VNDFGIHFLVLRDFSERADCALVAIQAFLAASQSSSVSVHLIMNRFFPIFALAFLVASTAKAEFTNNVATNEVVPLRVTVLDVVPLRGFKGSLTPTTDVDPRFALTVRIESSAPAITNLESGTVVTFAVHSPSRFLGGSAKKGETREITMPRKHAINLLSENRANEHSGGSDPAKTNELYHVGMSREQLRVAVSNSWLVASATRPTNGWSSPIAAPAGGRALQFEFSHSGVVVQYCDVYWVGHANRPDPYYGRRLHYFYFDNGNKLVGFNSVVLD
jgi:hypothetical protein